MALITKELVDSLVERGDVALDGCSPYAIADLADEILLEKIVESDRFADMVLESVREAVQDNSDAAR